MRIFSVTSVMVWLTLLRSANAYLSTTPRFLPRSSTVGVRAKRSRTKLYLEPLKPIGAYQPQRDDDLPSSPIQKKSLHPKVGDIVRFFDLDGGRARGQRLVGKIVFIQKVLGKDPNDWLVDVKLLEDTGDGYFAEYPSYKRKEYIRKLEEVSPISAAFVRTEQAYKVPLTKGTEDVMVRQEKYDLDDYEGPFVGPDAINEDIVAEDFERYDELKTKLLRDTAIVGAAGAVLVGAIKGPEDAVLYFMGCVASIAYLFFLTVKTDTLASPGAKLGSNISGLRFATPLIAVAAVAGYNLVRGQASGIFSTVTAEQFGALTIGFLSYRLPLFVGQSKELLGDWDEDNLPIAGSAGLALQMAKGDDQQGATTLYQMTTLTPVLVVSGPDVAGRSELVNKFIDESDGRFVRPIRVDRLEDELKFELLKKNDEFISIEPNGRYGVTKEGILQAGTAGESAVVVDADVETTKRLATISGARLIGVWVSLNSVLQIKSMIEEQVDKGEVELDPVETKDSYVRDRMQLIVKEIEYGVLSGIFEFTILNTSPEESLSELRQASEYCFR